MIDLIDRVGLRDALYDADAITFRGLEILNTYPVAKATELPCKIGDRVWAIRSYKGIKRPMEGVVSEMFFTPCMRLVIVVKHVVRGVWGETVFGTYEETENAIEERRTDATD